MADTPTDPDTAKIITVADGFYVRQEVDNMGWVDLGDCVLVVDALEQAHLEEEVFEAISSTVGDKPVRYVLNTHTHYDHIALNPAFAKRCGAEIVNQSDNPVPAEGRWFEGSRRRVRMLPMPGAHTREDCIVWAPEDNALFVGDIFGWGLVPLIIPLRDDTVALVLDIFRRLIDVDAAVVIPGHGPLCTTEELRRWVAYFDWLVKQTAEACGAGKTADEIRNLLPPPDDMTTWWRFLDWKHEDSVEKVIKAVCSGALKP